MTQKNIEQYEENGRIVRKVTTVEEYEAVPTTQAKPKSASRNVCVDDVDDDDCVPVRRGRR